MKIITIGLLFTTSMFGATTIVNKTCPYSGKPVKENITYTISVCCKKCASRATKDIKNTLARVKDVTKCPFSGRAGKQKLTIGFCCKNCLRKGKNQGN
tara:strand:+ start:652 stop:945 length:294 start_codon:yes stop_codon:yes gene_type:complete